MSTATVAVFLLAVLLSAAPWAVAATLRHMIARRGVPAPPTGLFWRAAFWLWAMPLGCYLFITIIYLVTEFAAGGWEFIPEPDAIPPPRQAIIGPAPREVIYLSVAWSALVLLQAVGLAKLLPDHPAPGFAARVFALVAGGAPILVLHYGLSTLLFAITSKASLGAPVYLFIILGAALWARWLAALVDAGTRVALHSRGPSQASPPGDGPQASPL
ncbi:hypothetical protein [Vannielia litorea]|uniref:hypothetical protein n=1 Tax=Vannielia litorea TaxID=1217970 RepID=UPI001C95878C|nr:hypothetical protein [Vannielia litorea]MBY6047403.1 hypothetical protein [Vannielia litorea]MBY6074817.1 hypothetical protein [Vannielia litorea]